MSVATAPPSAVLLPLYSASSSLAGSKVKVRRRQQRQKGGGQKQQRHKWQWGGLPSNVAWVVRQDREFLMTKLEQVAAPLHRLQGRVSKALDDFFWLRFLEEEGAAPRTFPSWPSPSYPGLFGMDLLKADLEVLKFYVSYLYCMSKAWSVPLPETYDPQTVDHYFKCRPHILAVRVLEVFSAFASAAIKMRASRSKFNSNLADKHDNRVASQYYMGQLLKESILNLGPTFIKVGQSLSTRPDIIGAEITKALSELYDKVPPFPRSVAMKTIEDELGCPVDDAFSYISEEPVAAASFGQVYQGCTHDGYLVAVKVQRPDLLHEVVRDIYILRIGLGILWKIAKRKSDPRLYADELGKGFVGELDYRLEAANAIEFREAHAKYSFISAPIVFKHLSRKKVLTMEWLVGEIPNDLLSLSRSSAWGNVDYTQQLYAKKCVLDLVNKGVEASLVQLLETGILHADPHPGNLRYTPEGSIGFLDFGLLCRMQKKHQLAMLASIVHIVNGDWGALVQDLTEMDVVPPTTNIRRVTMDLEEALGSAAFNGGIPDIKFSRVLGKIWSIAFKYHFRMPPYFTLVLRSLASLEGLAVTTDHDFKAFRAAYPYVVQKLLYDNSAETRRILYSVVFNKRMEFQWQKVSLFLKRVSLRKGRNGLTALGTSFPDGIHGQQSVCDVAYLILRLLPSKDGVVLRRLLMNADAASLARAMVSGEAVFFRRQVSRALADLIYQWVTNVFTRQGAQKQHGHDEEDEAQQLPRGSSSSVLLATLKDRRVKVISYRVLKAIKNDPALMLRVGWVALKVFLSSLALALHHLLVTSENVASPLPFGPRLSAVGA